MREILTCVVSAAGAVDIRCTSLTTLVCHVVSTTITLTLHVAPAPVSSVSVLATYITSHTYIHTQRRDGAKFFECCSKYLAGCPRTGDAAHDVTPGAYLEGGPRGPRPPNRPRNFCSL